MKLVSDAHIGHSGLWLEEQCSLMCVLCRPTGNFRGCFLSVHVMSGPSVITILLLSPEGRLSLLDAQFIRRHLPCHQANFARFATDWPSHYWLTAQVWTGFKSNHQKFQP